MVKKKSPSKSKKDPKLDLTSEPEPLPPSSPASPIPIVGIGASAGGLEACSDLLKNLSATPGMAFVVVQHLDPKHPSLLVELLSRVSPMRVSEAKDGMQVHPNHVYVMPHDAYLSISNNRLLLIPRDEGNKHMPIDTFFHSLAEDQQACAIGVILSGSASDGTLGLKSIKAEGGVTFAQSEETAKHYDMPRNAVAAGVVDFVLSPQGIAQELKKIAAHMVHAKHLSTEELSAKHRDSLNRIFGMLRNAMGVDFTFYKPATIRRRINRRIILHKLDKIEDYVQYLRKNSEELEALFHDILINVTGFFRDSETFEMLKEKIFPEIMKNRPLDSPLRIWVPGCSTGEEAYSHAMCLLEYFGNSATIPPIQIFATDISERALEKARAGIYSEASINQVPKDRLRRFFTKIDGGYQISKSIRDICIFAKQNITKDPPFSRLDIVSCRNLLIYLGPVLQKKILPIFHYALNPSGFLLLGTSETIGGFSELFSLFDKKHKIYLKKQTSARLTYDFTLNHALVEKEEEGAKKMREPWKEADLQKETDRILLDHYAPAGVVINQDMEILQFRGHTGPYLEPSPGEATFNLLKMAREGLGIDLRTSIQKAKKDQAPVRKNRVRVKANGHSFEVNLEIIPFKPSSSKSFYFLILFEENKASHDGKAAKKKGHGRSDKEDSETYQLKRDLAAAKEYLQSIIEEQEATNEELRSANEEILSSNEELQSTNEELETAKEELQSTNEELTTLNEELQNRNLELAQVNNDLNNLLSSINIPILMLGNDLTIRRYTPLAQKVLNLIPTDIGRPITNIKTNLRISDLGKMISEVIDTMKIAEMEVQDQDDHWYHLRIRPYKTSEGKIEGAVMTLLDIDEMKRNIDNLKISRDYADSIIETVSDPLLVLDANLRVKRVNRAFSQIFGISKEMAENHFFYDLAEGALNMPKLLALLEDMFSENRIVEGYEIVQDFPRLGRKAMLLNARQIFQGKQRASMILVALQDITARKHAEDISRQQLLLKEGHHRVKNNLQLITSLLNLQAEYIHDEKILAMFKDSQNRIRAMALVHDILSQNKELARINFREYIERLTSALFHTYGAVDEQRKLSLKIEPIFLRSELALNLGLILNELVTNSLKHAFPGSRKGEIHIEFQADGDSPYLLTVSDNGIGCPFFDFLNPRTLGIQLVSTLIKQIEASLIYENPRVGTGTVVKILLPEKAIHRDT